MGFVANVAQLVEQLTRNEQVTGSNPVTGSLQSLIISGFAFLDQSIRDIL